MRIRKKNWSGESFANVRIVFSSLVKRVRKLPLYKQAMLPSMLLLCSCGSTDPNVYTGTTESQVKQEFGNPIREHVRIDGSKELTYMVRSKRTIKHVGSGSYQKVVSVETGPQKIIVSPYGVVTWAPNGHVKSNR